MTQEGSYGPKQRVSWPPSLGGLRRVVEILIFFSDRGPLPRFRVTIGFTMVFSALERLVHCLDSQAGLAQRRPVKVLRRKQCDKNRVK